jgi:hypothetical protein
MPAINLSPLTAEQESLDRRRKMAEAMQQQAILPIEMPTVPGAKVSHLQGFAKLLQGYIAGKNLERAEEEKKQYEADTMSDFAKIYGLAGRTVTVPGAVTTAAVPSAPIPENIAQQEELERLSQPKALFEAKAAYGGNPILANAEQIKNLPTMSEAQPEVRAPSQQVPALKAEMLNDPKFTQTSAGRMMLAQALMQQQAQQQAEALRKREAESAIQSVAPGATLFQGGKVIYTNPKDSPIQSVAPGATLFQDGKAIYTNPKDSPIREVKTIDANGMPVTKYIPENVLLTMGAIPDQFKGFASDLIMSKYLPPAIMNDPQLLNLVGSQLNKAAGQVTQEDVSNYMLRVAETRAKLGYEGIPFPEPKPLVAAPNPLIKPTLPKGVPLNAVQTGKFTPDGRPVYQTPDGKNHVEDK